VVSSWRAAGQYKKATAGMKVGRGREHELGRLPERKSCYWLGEPQTARTGRGQPQVVDDPRPRHYGLGGPAQDAPCRGPSL